MIATASARLALVLLLAAVAIGCNRESPKEAARTPGMPDASEEVSTSKPTEAPYVTKGPPIAPQVVTPPPTPTPAAQTTAGGEVPVTLSEYRIDMPDTLPAGPTTFRIVNAGQTDHSFEIVGTALERRLDTLLKPGENRQLVLDLKPGTFKVYCPVGTHSDQGMSRTLKVTEGAQPQAAP